MESKEKSRIDVSIMSNQKIPSLVTVDGSGRYYRYTMQRLQAMQNLAPPPKKKNMQSSSQYTAP